MKLSLLFVYCWLLSCSLSNQGACGQPVGSSGGPGILPTRFYLPSQYNAHSQNFAFTQDHRGVIYIGNFAGVLEYDGLNWQTIPTRNITKVSALTTAKNGRVYVGGNGEFGYLSADSTGNPYFVSLSERGRVHFGDVLTILETADGIYFVTKNIIFRWQGRKLTEFPSPVAIESAFLVGQTLYVFQRKLGLSTFKHGVFIPVLGSGAGLESVVAMLPLDNNGALLVTRSQGLFRVSKSGMHPWPNVANNYLIANQAAGAAKLKDNTIAIATAQGGLVVLAPDGNTKQVIQTIRGLTGETINALFADREGNLWVALNNGLAELELPSPLTHFDQSARQMGEVMDIRQVNGTVYLATTNGLFAIRNASVQPVAGLTTGCFSLAQAAGSLFVATSSGVYQVVAGRARPVTSAYSFHITASAVFPDRLYVGTETGLGILSVSTSRQPAYRLVPGLTERIVGVTEDLLGAVWLETLTAGLYKWTPATGQFDHYTTRQGLPTLLYNRVAATTQGVLVYNEKGIYRFNPKANSFSLHNPFKTRLPATAYWKNELLEDEHGSIWTVEGDKKHITLYQKESSGFRPVTTPFMPLSTAPINVIYPDKQGIVWFGGRDGVLRYDPAIHKPYDTPYQALIRQIQTAGGKKIFGGYVPVPDRTGTSGTSAPIFSYEESDISFEFSAADYAVGNVLTFATKLENYDKIWSESVASKNRKDYTNLPAGSYRFRVKARNLYDLPSQEAVYEFTVLPPWYAYWWSIALFLAVGGLLIFWLVRWRLRVLVREKQKLETLIQERTEEVVFQKEELEKQSGELAIKNDQLEKIDQVVQSINTEIDFKNLFQTILAKFSIIKNMSSASFLVYDKQTNSFQFRALRSNRNLSHVESVQLTQEQAERRFLAQAVEEYEDIYRKNEVQYELLYNPVDDLATPQSLITIVVKNEGRIDGFITLENTTRPNAFDQRDLSMIRSLKEHLIAAFIKTRLLENLENTLNDLKNTQGELLRQERLASVGQLTKGIVDRILNPLNYVSNFSQLSEELIDELITILESHKETIPPEAMDDMLDEMSLLRKNLSKIQEHSNSTTRILKDMQKLLREKSQDFLETDLRSFLDSKVRTIFQEISLRYHGFSVGLVMDLDPDPVRVRLLPHEFGQVIENIISNSYYTLHEKSKQIKDFRPEVHITTEVKAGQVQVQFRDNGKGIAQSELTRLFNPFFTTKPTSDGTGLGLFMTKDIIQIHRGQIEIDSKEGEFTVLKITLPVINH